MQVPSVQKASIKYTKNGNSWRLENWHLKNSNYPNWSKNLNFKILCKDINSQYNLETKWGCSRARLDCKQKKIFKTKAITTYNHLNQETH